MTQFGLDRAHPLPALFSSPRSRSFQSAVSTAPLDASAPNQSHYPQRGRAAFPSIWLPAPTGAGADRSDLRRRGTHRRGRDRLRAPRDYFKPDFFNGIGRQQPRHWLARRSLRVELGSPAAVLRPRALSRDGHLPLYVSIAENRGSHCEMQYKRSRTSNDWLLGTPYAS